MWGSIYTEASYQLNFNTSFSTTRSDVLLHLSQWQYWWWFWFVFIWSFYYLLISKVVRHRSLKMRPRIATSIRPHGKWGDFVAAIIPTIWCINIICNSNFIMRLIEWQTESSLLTIRVRARQWYWIYKIDTKSIIELFTTPKNIGRNKWVYSTVNNVAISDSYYSVLELRSQHKWLTEYWNKILIEDSINKTRINLTIENHSTNSIKGYSTLNSNYNYFNDILLNDKYLNTLKKDFSFFMSNTHIYGGYFSFPIRSTFKPIGLPYSFKTKTTNYPFSIMSHLMKSKQVSWLKYLSTRLFETNHIINKKEDFSKYNSIFFNEDFNMSNYDFNDNSRFIKRTQGVKLPLRFTKTLFNYDVKNDQLFNIQYSENSSFIKSKIKPYANYLILKQKRYKRKKIITPLTTTVNKSKINWKPVLINNKFFINNDLDGTISYKMFKKSKIRSEMLPVVLSKRILRTKRTLVLPAHINLTVITSSYDIIHSWFIPGLGLKLDCVPGRSTHHTFFIDNVGFYYGQCAEICGRYHHHMPIRICALPFDHFLVWWYNFGLPKMLISSNTTKYGIRKYSW